MKVLVIDDIPQHAQRLQQSLTAEDRSTVCGTYEDAARFLRQADEVEWPDLVLLDAFFPLQPGTYPEFSAERVLDLLQKCSDAKGFRLPVVILVSSDRRVAAEFTRIGHWLSSGTLFDVLEKGADPIFGTLLRHKINQSRPIAQLRSAGYADAVASLEAHGIITRDPDLAAYLWFEICAAATSGKATWISAERGSGKNAIAHAISMIRARRQARVFNCSSCPSSLLESAIFGTEKGTANDAVDRKSLFEEARDGVLFFDEFCSVRIDQQRLLNQVVEYGLYSRVAHNVVRRATCMFVFADLLPVDVAVNSGKLLADVRDRLKRGISVPPLRDRATDIPALVDHFRAKENHKLRKNVVFDGDVLDRFMRGLWPGNIRALQTIVEGVVQRREGVVTWDEVTSCYDRDPIISLDREIGAASVRGRSAAPLPIGALPDGASDLLVLLSKEVAIQDPWSWRALVPRDAGSAEEVRVWGLISGLLNDSGQRLLAELRQRLGARGNNTPKPIYHYEVLLYLALHPDHVIDRKRIGNITGLATDDMHGRIGVALGLPSVVAGGPVRLVTKVDVGRRFVYQLDTALLLDRGASEEQLDV